MQVKLKVWRQKSPSERGKFAVYQVDANPEMSMLECLDVLNEGLTEQGEEPVAFEHDCREGICGSCGFMINGVAHGPLPATTVCQLTMRHFKEGQELVIEPWRAKAFPLIKDLVVDRRAFDRIIASGGTSPSPPATPPTATPFRSRKKRRRSHGRRRLHWLRRLCRRLPNASAALFTGAKITHLASAARRTRTAISALYAWSPKPISEGFGGCTNIGECTGVCPKGIPHRSSRT